MTHGGKVSVMMKQQYSFPGRGSRDGRTCGGCDRAPYRARQGTGFGGSCGLGGRNLTNRDMRGTGNGRTGTYPSAMGTVTPGPCTKPAPDKTCGCGNGTAATAATAACRKLMDQIRAVDFALYEVILYLDVYPGCHEALETYHKLRERSEMLRREYETTVGPLTAFGNESTTSWDWMKKPFPWEYDAE